MNGAYLDMLHCPNTTTNVAGNKGMEMSVLERQKIALKRQQEKFFPIVQHQEELSYYNDLSMLPFLPAQAQEFWILDMNCCPPLVATGPMMNEVIDRPMKADLSTENGWMDYGMQQSGVTVENSGIESVGQVNSPCYEINYAVSRTTSLQPIVSVASGVHNNDKGREDPPSEQRLGGANGRESFKKRKAEKNLMTPKIGEAEGSKTKRSKGCLKEEESKITEQNNYRNSNQSKQKETSGNTNDTKNKETSGFTSKDNFKASEVQKPDYIHVRARRGQATDSHSLAERVRREKISERMRYLQDLVPGCNKITGKAGMLDEIINYVQSLQRQVEFLSLKLAAASPSLDFDIDDLIAKEVLAACSLPPMDVSSDLTTPNYLQYNIPQIDHVCGSEVTSGTIHMGLQRNINFPVSMPETCYDTSFFNVTNTLQWGADLQNIYNME